MSKTRREKLLAGMTEEERARRRQLTAHYALLESRRKAFAVVDEWAPKGVTDLDLSGLKPGGVFEALPSASTQEISRMSQLMDKANENRMTVSEPPYKDLEFYASADESVSYLTPWSRVLDITSGKEVIDGIVAGAFMAKTQLFAGGSDEDLHNIRLATLQAAAVRAANFLVGPCVADMTARDTDLLQTLHVLDLAERPRDYASTLQNENLYEYGNNMFEDEFDIDTYVNDHPKVFSEYADKQDQFHPIPSKALGDGDERTFKRRRTEEMEDRRRGIMIDPDIPKIITPSDLADLYSTHEKAVRAMRRTGPTLPGSIQELASLHNVCVAECMGHLTTMHTAMSAFFGGVPDALRQQIVNRNAARVLVFAGYTKKIPSVSASDGHIAFTVDLMATLANQKAYLYPNRSDRRPSSFGNLENAAANLNATLFLLRNLFENTIYEANTFTFKRAPRYIGQVQPIETLPAPQTDVWHELREPDSGPGVSNQ